MLGVDLTPALVILGVALALAVAVRVALGVGAARARRLGERIVASVPKVARQASDAATAPDEKARDVSAAEPARDDGREPSA